MQAQYPAGVADRQPDQQVFCQPLYVAFGSFQAVSAKPEAVYYKVRNLCGEAAERTVDSKGVCTACYAAGVFYGLC